MFEPASRPDPLDAGGRMNTNAKLLNDLNVFREQGKNYYSVAEIAALTRQKVASVRVSLSRWIREGSLVRYAQGCYGSRGCSDLAGLVSAMDRDAYLTGASALMLYGVITQVIQTHTAFTCHQGTRGRRPRATALGDIVFRTVVQPIYAPPVEGQMVALEQAFLDFAYLSRLQGLSIQGQFTYRDLHQVDRERLMNLAIRYPQTTQVEVLSLLNTFTASTTKPG